MKFIRRVPGLTRDLIGGLKEEVPDQVRDGRDKI